METLIWKYVKALKDDNSIVQFERKYGIQLPEDIVECFKENNGGRPNRKVFDTELTKGRTIKCILSFNMDDLETIYSPMVIINAENPRLVPIAVDPGGNYICYNIAKNNIVLWLHEMNSTEAIAATFTDFLKGLY